MTKKYKRITKAFLKFFETSGLNRDMLAHLCHISPNYLRKVMMGYVNPSKRLKIDIIEKTDGFIKEEDFDG